MHFILLKGIWSNFWCQNKSVFCINWGITGEQWLTTEATLQGIELETSDWTELEIGTWNEGIDFESSEWRKYNPLAALLIFSGLLREGAYIKYKHK